MAGKGIPHHLPGACRWPHARLQLALWPGLLQKNEAEPCSSTSTLPAASGHPESGELGIPPDTPRETQSRLALGC